MSLETKIADVKVLLTTIEHDFLPATFANSLGAEDMVLTDLIATHAPGIEMFILETGRLPKETLALMTQLTERYKLNLQIYRPEAQAVEFYVKTHGLNAFYESVELRKSCCNIRKVEPLRRALAGKKAWITGMRRDQAVSRTALTINSFDEDNGLEKFNPLADWTQLDIWTYLARFKVPYNALHDKGYPSIGCEPCTRAIKPGEDIRAGRWWWEQSSGKECGLHPRKSEAA